MITHCRLPFRFDAARLRADLDRAAGLPWSRHFLSDNYRGEWSALALRAIAGGENNIYAHPHPPEDYGDTEVLAACAYLREVLARFRCPLGSVRLMKLAPGSQILEHVDPGCGYEDGQVRLHVPITTSPEVEFYLDRERVTMQPGECWYLNFQLPHRAVNAGTADRVHLVLDCTVNPWLDAVFQDLGFGPIEKLGSGERLLDDNIEGLRRLDTPAARIALASLQQQKAEVEAARRARAESAAQGQPLAQPPPSK